MFIDLRKAFDSVDHDLLISQLQSYGLKNTKRNWFKSYLSGRKQLVHIGKETSDCYPITWYKITHAGEQVAQWDLQNNAPAFVLEVSLRNLLTSMCDFVPCDRVVQRA